MADHPDVAELLIRSGADINAEDKVRLTLIPSFRYCAMFIS